MKKHVSKEDGTQKSAVFFGPKKERAGDSPAERGLEIHYSNHSVVNLTVIPMHDASLVFSRNHPILPEGIPSFAP